MKELPSLDAIAVEMAAQSRHPADAGAGLQPEERAYRKLLGIWPFGSLSLNSEEAQAPRPGTWMSGIREVDVRAAQQRT